jgi:hypothetical protein
LFSTWKPILFEFQNFDIEGLRSCLQQIHFLNFILPSLDFIIQTFEQLSQHSNWLRAARPRREGSIPGCCKTLFLSIASGSALQANGTPFKRTPTVISSGLSRRVETVLTHSYSAKLRKSGATSPFMAGIKLLQSMLLLGAPPSRTNPKRLVVHHTYHNFHLQFILRLQCQFRFRLQ